MRFNDFLNTLKGITKYYTRSFTKISRIAFFIYTTIVTIILIDLWPAESPPYSTIFFVAVAILGTVIVVFAIMKLVTDRIVEQVKRSNPEQSEEEDL